MLIPKFNTVMGVIISSALQVRKLRHRQTVRGWLAPRLRDSRVHVCYPFGLVEKSSCTKRGNVIEALLISAICNSHPRLAAEILFLLRVWCQTVVRNK